MQGFWLCWVEGTGGGQHYRHFTGAKAQAEAERLASLPDVKGKTVYVFECVGKCRAESVRWELPK